MVNRSLKPHNLVFEYQSIFFVRFCVVPKVAIPIFGEIGIAQEKVFYFLLVHDVSPKSDSME
jgi:hypothetical protein